MALPILSGTQANFDAIATKDNSIIYLITDTSKIYLGNILLANSSTVSGKNVEDITYDSSTATFTIDYTDGTTGSIDLVLETLLSSISYADHTLTLTLVNGSTSTIDLTDLIDAYSAENSDTITTTIISGVIKSETVISTDIGNVLKNQNGLFVGEQDLSIGTF